MSELRREQSAPPVRLVHLGLGNFFRAHQAWHTDETGDTESWGFAAFTGRRGRARPGAVGAGRALPGRVPPGAVRALAAWVCHLRGLGAPVIDARAEEVVALADGPLPAAVRRVLDGLDPAVGADDEVVRAVLAATGELDHR